MIERIGAPTEDVPAQWPATAPGLSLRGECEGAIDAPAAEARPSVPRIAVVIPAYNVAAHIAGVLGGIPPFVSWVIVVDDGSLDDTAELVRGYAIGDPRVHLVAREVNGGVGAAVFSGYERALKLGADIVVKMDGDGQMDPAYLGRLVTPILLGQADYAKANRFLHFGALGAMPPLRRLGNIGLSFLTKLSSGYWGVFDPTNGYTAIHATVIRELERSRIHERYFFETSMLLELGLARAVVRDVPIPARYGQEVSGLSELRALRSFPGPLLRAFLRRILVLYFVRDFTLASFYIVNGLWMLLFALIWGAYHWALSVRTGLPATTGTVMIAVLPLILGAQLLLQAASLDVQNVPQTPLSQNEGRATWDERTAGQGREGSGRW